jgi:hypothetical protein
LLFEPKLKNIEESDWNALLETMQPHIVFNNQVSISVEGWYGIHVHLLEFPDYNEEWYHSKTPVYPRSLLMDQWIIAGMNSAYTYWDYDVTLTQKLVRRITRDDIKRTMKKDLSTCEVYLQDPNSRLDEWGVEMFRREKWSLEMTFENIEDILDRL